MYIYTQHPGAHQQGPLAPEESLKPPREILDPRSNFVRVLLNTKSNTLPTRYCPKDIVTLQK